MEADIECGHADCDKLVTMRAWKALKNVQACKITEKQKSLVWLHVDVACPHALALSLHKTVGKCVTSLVTCRSRMKHE
jgi:hypothetical protein